MKEYVIGVDIGATKSHLALFDVNGDLIDFGRWGRLNYETLPGLYAQFEEELGQFVSGIISKNGISMEQVSYSVLGVGGIDTKKQHITISEILEKLGFKRFTLVNDAFLGIPAGNKTGIGICAINGSGCTLAGINKEGRMLQIGGVGAVSADMGGGAYMGERLVSAVYSELFRKGRATLMTSLLFKELGITSKYDYIEKIHEKQSGGFFDINKCGAMVFEAVRQNDPVAAGILREMADNYANGISCMIEELKFPRDEELHVVFAGSVFVKGEHPLLLDSIKDKVSGDNQGWNIAYKLLDVPNVAGAVIWALDSINNNSNKNDKNVHYNKVCRQLRDL
jgi:N-acetylglucosamine kinase-like BadF-type ATPase